MPVNNNGNTAEVLPLLFGAMPICNRCFFAFNRRQMFRLTSEITIGKFQFTGVHDVRVLRGIYGYMDRAFIKVPSTARIAKGQSASPAKVTTAHLFTDGQPVTIKLGYNGVLQTEFEGFIKRRNLNIPLEIECEGYSYLLRKKQVDANLSQGIDVKDFLALACKGTGVDIECPVSFKIYGRNLVKSNGIAVLDEIKKCSDRTLTVFFKEPKVLFCGLVYTPYLAGTKVFDLPTVRYKLGYNVVKDNGLREKLNDDPVQVYVNGLLASGDSVQTASDLKVQQRHVQMLVNGVHDKNVVRTFANEKASRQNYSGYEGHINAFLEPYCAPGYDAVIMDSRYPERNGTYLVESTEVRYGVNGARRIVGIGPKLG